MKLELTEAESVVDFLSTREDVTNVRKEIVESKSELAHHIWDTKVGLSGSISKTNERVSSVETKLTAEFSKTSERISSVETKLTEKISSVETNLTVEISKTNERISETNERISSVETKLTEKISSVETSLTAEISKTNERISDLKIELKGDVANVQSEMKKQFKWFIGIMVTLFGVMMSMMIYMLTKIS